MARGHPILRLPRRDPQDRQHDECDRGIELESQAAIRARGHFPSDEAATELFYLILNRSEQEGKFPPREWSMANAQFAVIFGERFIRTMAA